MSTENPDRSPTPQAHAEQFYGDSFDVRTEEERDEAAALWFESSAGDQRFVVAHLLHLILQTLEGTRRLMVDHRDRLDDVVTLLERDEDEEPEKAQPPAFPDLDELLIVEDELAAAEVRS